MKHKNVSINCVVVLQFIKLNYKIHNTEENSKKTE